MAGIEAYEEAEAVEHTRLLETARGGRPQVQHDVGRAVDLSAVLPDDVGVGLFLRALLGYSAAPELVTLLAYVAYIVPVLVFYLRPVPVAEPSEVAAALPGGDTIGAR